MRLLVRAAAGVAGAGIAIFAGAGAMDDNTTRDESGAIVEAGGLGAFVMRSGDCFNEPDAEEVLSVEGIPCAEPHDAEVFSLYDLPGEEFPTDRLELAEDAWWGCYGRFDGYIGRPYETSTFDIGTMTPTSESWAQGDREVVCYVFDYEGQKLTAGARNSRL